MAQRIGQRDKNSCRPNAQIIAKRAAISSMALAGQADRTPQIDFEPDKANRTPDGTCFQLN